MSRTCAWCIWCVGVCVPHLCVCMHMPPCTRRDMSPFLIKYFPMHPPHLQSTHLCMRNGRFSCVRVQVLCFALWLRTPRVSQLRLESRTQRDCHEILNNHATEMTSIKRTGTCEFKFAHAHAHIDVCKCISSNVPISACTLWFHMFVSINVRARVC